MRGYLGTEEQERLREAIKQAERDRAAKVKDRFGLPPVKPGFVRGHAIKIRQSDELCEYGLLKVLEFEVADTRQGPGVPVRMAGTYITGRMREGTLLDVPDPTPSVRPITPDVVYRSQNPKMNETRASYPGRGATPRTTSVRRGLIVLVVPAVIALAIIVGLKIFAFSG